MAAAAAVVVVATARAAGAWVAEATVALVEATALAPDSIATLPVESMTVVSIIMVSATLDSMSMASGIIDGAAAMASLRSAMTITAAAIRISSISTIPT